MDLSTEFQIVGRVVVVAIPGGMVGIEREFAERPAGLRTQMLVGAPVTIFVMLATEMIQFFEPHDIVTVEPVRVVESTVVGVSLWARGQSSNTRVKARESLKGGRPVHP